MKIISVYWIFIALYLIQYSKQNQEIIPLMNKDNTLYSGDINIDHQNFTVVFDTGSHILWVASNLCKNCEFANSTYFIDENNQYLMNELKNNQKTQKYVDAKSVGYQTDAIIGFNSNLTQNKIEYPIILTVQTANLQYLQGDGVLGLDIKNNVFQIMYEQHIISTPYFTFALKDFGQQSNLYYGETAKYLFNKSTQYQSGKSNRWYLEFNGVQLESRLHNLDAKKYILTDYSFQIALVDTGTSHILFVKKIWDKIYKIFTNDLQLCKENDQLEIPLAPNSLICSDSNDSLKKYPILHFNTNQGRISLTYKQYMNHYFSEKAQKTVFTMMMAQHPQNRKNIVGSPFFRNNYISFDPLNKQIGIQVVQEYETIDFFPYASILICIFLIKIFFVFGLIYWGILLQDSLDKYIKQQPYQELAIKV